MNKIYGRKGKSSRIPQNYNQSILLTLWFDRITELAHGRWTSSGFKLLKGSRISQDHKGQKNANIKSIISELLKDNVLEGEGTVYYILKSEITLHSPSTAACLVFGNSRNGYTSWKNKDKTLKQLLDKNTD